MHRKYAIRFIMSKTPETPLPITNWYRGMLADQIEACGRNRVARAARIDPATVWRNVSGGNMTYSTALKLRDAILSAYRENGEALPCIPPPIVEIDSLQQYNFIQLYERLSMYPGLVDEVISGGLEKLHERERDELLASANSLVAHPLRNQDG